MHCGICYLSFIGVIFFCHLFLRQIFNILNFFSRFHGGQRPYSCQDCGVSFARKFELVNHGRIHGRVPHSCAVCGKEFLQKRTLLAHSRLHTASDETEHPYSCIHCGEAFTAKAALAAHTCGDKEKNFVCR